MSAWTERLQNWNEADAALTKAVDENREFWGWAFDEMTDAQGESLNAFFAATQKLADAALAEIAKLDETHDYWQERAERAEAEVAMTQRAIVERLDAILEALRASPHPAR